MGTPAAIGYKKTNNEVCAIYCNYDGYPDVVGAALFGDYQSEDKVIELVNGGDLSFLRAGEKESYKDRGEDWEDIAPRTYVDVDTYLQEEGTAYTYLWDGDKWLISLSRNEFILLRENFVEEN